MQRSNTGLLNLPGVATTHSGPDLPRNRVALFEIATYVPSNTTTRTERGRVRAISEDDSAFSIPREFTQTDAPKS